MVKIGPPKSMVDFVKNPYITLIDKVILFSYNQTLPFILTTLTYATSLTGIILMYIWYAPSPSCVLNIFFITLTLILVPVMTSIALHSKVSSLHGSHVMLFKIGGDFLAQVHLVKELHQILCAIVIV